MSRKTNRRKKKRNSLDSNNSPVSKKAFLVGNSKYARIYDLPQCEKEVRDMSVLCKKAGYAAQTYKNMTREDFAKKFAYFLKTIRSGDTILIYFTGHGSQRNGRQKLWFVEGKIFHEDIIEVINSIPGVSNIKIVSILDCCRNGYFDQNQGEIRNEFQLMVGDILGDLEEENDRFTNEFCTIYSCDLGGVAVGSLTKAMRKFMKKGCIISEAFYNANKELRKFQQRGHMDVTDRIIF